MRTAASILVLGAFAVANPVDPRFNFANPFDTVKSLLGHFGPNATPVSTTTAIPMATTSAAADVTEAVTTIKVHSTSTAFVTIPYPSGTSTQSVSVSAPATTASATQSASPSQTSLSSSDEAIGNSVSNGEATYYSGDLEGGTCSFTDYTIPSNLYGVAYSLPAWDGAANCGACVKVTGPNGNSINAMIVDACASCEASHLDLFPDAFSRLAAKSEGVIDISYEFIKCGISSPLELHNKDGSSSDWFSMQVVNSNVPIASLEVSTDGGSSWESTTRKEYNFFEKSNGFGKSTVDVRITSTTGETITVNDVKVASESSTTADSNF